jgi:hypothetical protein
MFELGCGIFVKWPHSSLSCDSRATALKFQDAYVMVFLA